MIFDINGLPSDCKVQKYWVSSTYQSITTLDAVGDPIVDPLLAGLDLTISAKGHVNYDSATYDYMIVPTERNDIKVYQFYIIAEVYKDGFETEKQYYYSSYNRLIVGCPQEAKSLMNFPEIP